MAEREKKATGSRRKTAEPTPPTPDEIAERAFEIYLARGGEPGHEAEDWLQAERELRQRSVSR